MCFNKSITGKILTIIFLLSTSGFLYAQQNRVEQALETLSQKYSQEKAYLLYNKQNYLAGENMWFKAFVFEGYNRSLISTSMWVELYNNKKVLINKKLIPLFDGEGQGSFALPDSLPEGVYYVRGYTQWMLNFDEAFQYMHALKIYNISSPQKLVPDTLSAWKAAAFPEGGTFVEGLANKVAIRLSSAGVLPEDWSGYVIDAAKPSQKLTSFTALDRNVSVFSIIPEKNIKYQVIVQDKKGKKQTISLPMAEESGVSLQVNSTTDAIFYSLHFKNLPADASGYKIIGTINNTLVYKANINKISPEITSSIPADKLINGVLQLTVFDGAENVLAQRLCFVQPEQLRIGRPAFPPLYLSNKPRGVNGFDMMADSNYLQYTVLVMDGNVKGYLDDENLLSALWLTGDFPGRIDAPARYFEYDANPAALDALLISEEWRRFNWPAVVNGKFPDIKYVPEPYLSYKGTVYGGGGVIANDVVNLIFYFQDSTNQITQVNTDAKGSFELKNLIYEEPLKVYYQVNDKKIAPKDVSITFEPLNKSIAYSSPLPASGYILAKRSPNDKVSDEIARSMNTLDNQIGTDTKFKTLQEVKIVAQGKSEKEKLNEKLSSGMFRSMNEDVFDLVNENKEAAAYANILQWLQGRVAGLQIQMQGGSYVPILRGSQVDLYLDEIRVDASTIGSLPVSDIAMVKVIKGGFVGGVGGGGGGAVAIYTRRGDTQSPNAQKPPSLNSSTLPGYDKPLPFIEPEYKDASVKRIEKDTRDALYWNPSVPSQPNKLVKIRFFNNDDAKSIKVIIIGFSKDEDVPLYYNDTFKLK
ncbi:MAG TPA: hypothetical protein VFV68_17655 [Agriterribacter sp.]|nr:hypothetical protein [Agriterribacter sp.]